MLPGHIFRRAACYIDQPEQEQTRRCYETALLQYLKIVLANVQLKRRKPPKSPREPPKAPSGTCRRALAERLRHRDCAFSSSTMTMERLFNAFLAAISRSRVQPLGY